MTLILKFVRRYLTARPAKTMFAFLVVSFGISMFVFLISMLTRLNGELQTVLNSELYVPVLIFLVALNTLIITGFGIYNNISSLVNKKVKDISILKINGFTKNDVGSIFFTHAFIIGFAGSVAGMVIGFLLTAIASRFLFLSSEIFNSVSFTGYFNPLHYFLAILFGIGATCLAAYLPARKASRTEPLLILQS